MQMSNSTKLEKYRV